MRDKLNFKTKSITEVEDPIRVITRPSNQNDLVIKGEGNY